MSKHVRRRGELSRRHFFLLASAVPRFFRFLCRRTDLFAQRAQQSWLRSPFASRSIVKSSLEPSSKAFFFIASTLLRAAASRRLNCTLLGARLDDKSSSINTSAFINQRRRGEPRSRAESRHCAAWQGVSGRKRAERCAVGNYWRMGSEFEQNVHDASSSACFLSAEMSRI